MVLRCSISRLLRFARVHSRTDLPRTSFVLVLHRSCCTVCYVTTPLYLTHRNFILHHGSHTLDTLFGWFLHYLPPHHTYVYSRSRSFCHDFDFARLPPTLPPTILSDTSYPVSHRLRYDFTHIRFRLGPDVTTLIAVHVCVTHGLVLGWLR